MAKFRIHGALGFLILALLGAVVIPASVVTADPTNPPSGPADIGVAVVIDFGSSTSAPAGPIKHCAKVPQGSSEADVLTQLAKDLSESAPTYASSGMPCSLAGYPGSGCATPTSNGVAYWSYWRSTSHSWSYSTTAPAQNKVEVSGDVEGWRFEDSGNQTSSDPQPSVEPDYAAICPPETTPTTAAPVSSTTTPPPFPPTTTVPPGIVGSLGGTGSGAKSTTGTTTPSRQTGGSADAPSGATANSPSPSASRQAAASTHPSSSSGTSGLVIGLLAAAVVGLGGAGAFWWRRRQKAATSESP